MKPPVSGKILPDPRFPDDPTRKKFLANLPPHPDGSRNRKTKYVEGTEAEIDAQYRAWMQQWEDIYINHVLQPSEQLLSDYLKWWLDCVVVINAKQRTFESYRNEIKKHIDPALGHNRLCELSPDLIQEFYAYELKRGYIGQKKAKGGKHRGLSRRTVEYHHAILRNALNHAVKLGKIATNPCLATKPPGTSAREKQLRLQPKYVLNESQLEDFLYNVAHFPHPHLKRGQTAQHEDYAFIYVAAYTGMRLSELLGLTWDCVNNRTKRIEVKKSLQNSQDLGLIHDDTVKNTSSARKIKVTDSVIEVLTTHRAKQARAMDKDKNYNPDHLVFPTKEGKAMHDYYIQKRFKTVARILGHPRLTIHCLRHTHATILIANGEPIKAVSERLGHADVDTTLRIYAHVLPEHEEATADHFEKIMEKQKEEKKQKGEGQIVELKQLE